MTAFLNGVMSGWVSISTVRVTKLFLSMAAPRMPASVGSIRSGPLGEREMPMAQMRGGLEGWMRTT
ncbi:MAG: hypothetical protein ACO34E_06465 [Limisphaerales bacterium]